MTTPLDESITKLLNASRDDLSDLRLSSSDRGFGFHAQQAIEKLLKVLISACGKPLEYTHDLAKLMKQLEDPGEQVMLPSTLPEDVGVYAVAFRYDEPEPFSEERQRLTRHIELLRDGVLTRISVQRPHGVWLRK